MFQSETIKLLPAELQWRTVVPKKGESLRGWVVGPLCLHTVHFVNKASRPCRNLLTGGGMHCYCATKPMSARQVGYQPFLTQAREKVVVLMCATTARKMSHFGQGSPLEFWRQNKDKSGLNVKHVMAEELGDINTANIARQKPWDIRPYLLKVLWQDSELVTYFEKVVPASGPANTTTVGKQPKYAPHRPKLPGYDNGPTVADIVKGLADATKVG